MPTDVYTEVTDRIVAALESGTVPWRRPWIAGADSHRNPVSGTVYRGVNPFLLELTAMERGYTDPRWMTFKQARAAGGNVRKGERSTLVIFWKMLKGTDSDTGEAKTIPMLRHYRVFNVAQLDGVELATEEQPDPFVPIDRAAELVAGMPDAPSISYGGERAFYAPAWDAVQLPQPERFVSAEAFYSTTFHELAHATGHASRLNRPEVANATHAFGSADYSREELVAEFSASMLCGVAGIAPAVIEQSAAYIAGWLKALSDDPKLLIAAAGRAQRAADFIRGEQPREQATT
jgi:antirestriction protein ArdC